MSAPEIEKQQQEEVYKFMAEVFGMKEGLFRQIAATPPGLEFSAHLPRKNQPELWADAPWRVEPEVEELPLLFVIRDGDVQPPGKGPYRLHALRVEQRLADGTWHPVGTLLPGDLPGVDDEGNVERNFWSHAISIPLVDPGPEPAYKLRLDEVARGGPPLHLKVLFTGSFFPYDEVEAPEIHLEVTWAAETLPGRRPSTPGGARHWFYGDTHYHSDHTNDVKEFGGPVAASRDAARAIGLDWLAITDHSCDLDEKDYGDGHKTRFELLRGLVASDLSDEHFRLILGEEVTLRGGNKGDHYVHMLAIGGLEEMVPGGFMPDRGGTFVTKAFKAAIEKVLNVLAKNGGYSPDNPRRLFGRVQTFDQVMEALPEGVVTFAAHPYHVAQPPFINSTWAQEDLDDLRLTGHEFWNGRSRRSALMTDDPFSKPGWTDPQKMAKKDRGRIDGIYEHVDAWDATLARGVDEWPAGRELPARRPVLVAGSDAHGSFNYSVGWGWDYKRQGLVDDNALGRARTAIYLPDHDAATVPEVGDIVAALGRGACAVTDGPLLEVRLTQAGRTAHLGEVLAAGGAGEIEMSIAGLTSGEFGAITQVEVITYFDGQAGGKPLKIAVPAGGEAAIDVEGRRGFCRAQVEMAGPGGERFCCFTNPIWLRLPAGQGARLRVEVR